MFPTCLNSKDWSNGAVQTSSSSSNCKKRPESTSESIAVQLHSDPNLSPEAAEQIAGIVKELYQALARPKELSAVHLRAATTFRPDAAIALGALLNDMHDALLKENPERWLCDAALNLKQSGSLPEVQGQQIGVDPDAPISLSKLANLFRMLKSEPGMILIRAPAIRGPRTHIKKGAFSACTFQPSPDRKVVVFNPDLLQGRARPAI